MPYIGLILIKNTAIGLEVLTEFRPIAQCRLYKIAYPYCLDEQGFEDD
jgi:hypothetical protein